MANHKVKEQKQTKQNRGFGVAWPDGRPDEKHSSVNWHFVACGVLGFSVGLLFCGVLISTGGA